MTARLRNLYSFLVFALLILLLTMLFMMIAPRKAYAARCRPASIICAQVANP